MTASWPVVLRHAAVTDSFAVSAGQILVTGRDRNLAVSQVVVPSMPRAVQ
jgi:hypothetical protein